ncbi:MAG TPA: chemotaxis protein CheA [Candidatus Didemnitutus sp.]|nr:chemotaxis protein CheA [Candidatus Didemnitutus sp.]
MPIAPESFAALDEILNRLATETILASPGKDEGLVPSYSLLGELREICALEPVLRDAVTAAHSALEKLLDAAQPFDAATLGQVRMLVDWMPAAAADVKAGEAPMPFTEAAPAVATAPTQEEAPAHRAAGDVLMELNIGENHELLTEFYAEAVDHLQQIEAALLVLDQQPENPEALNSIFRSFHTIKGNAGFLGLVPMHTLAHEVESLLDLARNHQLVLTPVIITEILRSRDALQALTQQVAVALEKGKLPDQIIPVSHLIRAVKQLASGSPASTPLAPAPADSHGGTSASAVVTGAGASTPAIAPVVAAPTEAAPVKAELASADHSTPPHQMVPEARSTGTSTAAQAAKAAPTAGASQTVRVNTEKLDSLMDVVGELVIVQSQIIESARANGDAGSPLQRNVAQLSRITKELQHTAMSLRMIPVKPTFQKMERLARDLARDFGKKVHFQVTGEDTELDRTVVEEIGDPLVHMVRNALDHGLDTTAERIAKGKPETGVVNLSAYHQGSNIVIELSDDGRGINPEKIFRKAVEKGVISADAQLTRDEVLALIFAPGFSTAEKVTSVSGRGVGMDVVKRNIEKLRGKIEIVSEVDKGSTFKIKLPLTMAIIDGLVVRVGTDKFILPSTSVQMAMRPAKEAITTVHGQGEVLELRGKILPLHRLHRRFGIPADAQQPWDGIVVIVEHSGKVSALLVDEMVSKQEVVIKNLGAFMQGLPGVAGGAILGDGNIALILDPGSLLQAA